MNTKRLESGSEDDELVNVQATSLPPPPPYQPTSEDLELLSRRMGECAKYKLMSGRYDPLTPEGIVAVLGFGGQHSYLLGKAITTWMDAVDHAICMTHLWAAEDANDIQVGVDLVEHSVEQRSRIIQATEVDPTPGELAVIDARRAWRSAVAQRNKLLAEWNDYVRKCKEYYHTLRDR